MAVNAHFDGKVVIPDEPLGLPPNQALITQIGSVGSRETADEVALAWLAANAVESDPLPADLCRPTRPLPLRLSHEGQAAVVASASRNRFSEPPTGTVNCGYAAF
jgi:hypothetical protein